jgi:hypothetical protein
MPSRIAVSRTLRLFTTALFLAFPNASSGHDIPNDVTVQMFVQPAGDRLRVLVCAPLKAMRDMEFPKRGPGYLDLARIDPLLADAATLWLANFIDIYEGDRKLPSPRVTATLVSLESDKSFASYEEALSHVTGSKLPVSTDVYWNQVTLDALFEYPIHSDQSKFSIHPGLARLGLRVVTVLRFSPASTDHIVRAFEFVGDPGVVLLDPRWHQAALRFVKLGFLHILEGTDHLLFLFCLVIPFRRFRTLVPIVTAFTVAHSFTLIASAYNLGPDALWFPPLIETLIAMSIVYMALENIAGGTTVHRRWMITFGFGLVHGFGFSFALRQSLQFAGSHLLTSLLSFNVGVELGQLLVLVMLIPILDILFRFVVAERMGTIILSALVAHTGWHWMIERWEILRQFRFEWPALNAALLANVLFWLMLLAIFAGLIWLVFTVLRHRAERRVESKAADGA